MFGMKAIQANIEQKSVNYGKPASSFNSFRRMTFEKMVILKVVMTGGPTTQLSGDKYLSLADDNHL